MSSVSSASKLEALRGLGCVKRILGSFFASESGVHSVMLYGSEGSGKTTVANILAQFWLCTNPGPEGACGECQACLAFERGKSVDFQLVEPKPPSRIIRFGAIRPSKQRDNDDETIPVDQFLRTPPLQARNKVVLIESADRMNHDAANALLKMLEEPHAYGKFILTTSAISRVLPTILSRCVTVVCEQPEPNNESEAARMLFATAAGRLDDIWDDMAAFANRVVSAPKAAGLRLSEDFREICDRIESLTGSNARTAQGEALHLLAFHLGRSAPERPEWVQSCIESHRRIVGNAHSTLVFDSLFCAITGSR